MMTWAAWIAFMAPLGGSLFAGVFGRYFKSSVSYAVAIFGILLSCGASFYLWKQTQGGAVAVVVLAPWLEIGQLKASWSVRVDGLTSLMMTLVGFISALVHFYAAAYMAKDEGRRRFFSFLSLFTFFMIVLVAANDLLQLFVGWEGVGIASYLLIGFWNQKDAANAAAIKAFIVNRVGDLALLLGIIGLFWLFDSVEYDVIFKGLQRSSPEGLYLLNVAAFLLFVGAMGKSAQIGFHVWLPDAMEGPTPVSALLHSATMVTAGVFLMIRMSPLLEAVPMVLPVIAVVGVLTAVFAGTIALTQKDIKRVIAYSTCSQLGFMFLAVGVGAYEIAFFHLFTHAFFKSLLFLGAGSVIQGMHHGQDMEHMGGLWRSMPYTHIVMLMGTLSLIGTPYFAGAVSKDLIMEVLWEHGGGLTLWIYGGALVGILLTSLYSWRLLFLTFYGAPRSEAARGAHESSWALLWPLGVLALCSVAIGGVVLPFFKIALASGDAVVWMHPLLWGILGGALVLALWYYLYPSEGRFGRVHRLFYNKWYVDDLYQKIFVKPALALGNFFWQKGDIGTIDRFGPDGVGAVVSRLSQSLRSFQGGAVYTYVAFTFLGLLLILLWMGVAG